jgi:hypothetical protein
MLNEGSGGYQEDSDNVLAAKDGSSLPPALRLQILTTEHWSLLSTRALSWNEAFSRATMFLAVLSGAVLALALVAQGRGFDEGFTTFALFILPVVLFVGIATFVRLVAINHEDVGWVIGMNLLRHAYLAAAPELRPYVITGSTDDEAGIMATFGARPGRGSFIHELVTTPGVVAVVNGVVAGVLLGVTVGRLADEPIGIAVAVSGALGTVVVQLLYQYRAVVKPRAAGAVRFPDQPSYR